jgi:DNA repair protein RadC
MATHGEVDFRILAGWIVHHGASAVVLAHNHPSGETSPSKADVQLTEMLGSWLKMMHCDLIEHLVLTAGEAAAIVGDW